VRVSLYKSGAEVKYLLFNGVNTDIETWYTFSLLIDSSWSDLNPGSTPPFYFDWWYVHG